MTESHRLAVVLVPTDVDLQAKAKEYEAKLDKEIEKFDASFQDITPPATCKHNCEILSCGFLPENFKGNHLGGYSHLSM